MLRTVLYTMLNLNRTSKHQLKCAHKVLISKQEQPSGQVIVTITLSDLEGKITFDETSQ